MEFYSLNAELQNETNQNRNWSLITKVLYIWLWYSCRDNFAECRIVNAELQNKTNLHRNWSLIVKVLYIWLWSLCRDNFAGWSIILQMQNCRMKQTYTETTALKYWLLTQITEHQSSQYWTNHSHSQNQGQLPSFSTEPTTDWWLKSQRNIQVSTEPTTFFSTKDSAHHSVLTDDSNHRESAIQYRTNHYILRTNWWLKS